VHITDLLPRENTYVPLEGPTLRQALKTMVADLAERGVVQVPGTLEDRIDGEPMRDAVVVSSRVVMPRYRTVAVPRLVLALGVAPEPLNAKEAGLDARPRVVVLALSPPDEASLFLQVLASLERLLHQDDVVDRILAAPTAADVLTVPALARLEVQESLAARDIMSRRVDAVPPSTLVREAVRLLVRNRIRAVPVVGDKGEVLGLVTDRHVMQALLPLPRETEEPGAGEGTQNLTVRDIMARSVLCISEELGIDEVVATMFNKDLELLPVVKDGAMTGVVTRTEIVRKLFGP